MLNDEPLLVENLIENYQIESKNKNYNSDYDSSGNNYFIGIRPGITYFLNNGISHESAAKKMVLAYTCDAQDLELVKYLITKSDAYKNETSALQWTAAKGNIPIMELLLGYFNEFNGIFCSAASTGQIELIQFLIDNNLQDFDSGAERAVFWAGERSKWNAVELLLKNNIGTLDNLGADYTAKLIDWREKTKKNNL